MKLFLIALLGLVLLNGCGGPSRQILGKWRMAGDTSGMIWEFAKDRSVRVGNEQGRYLLGTDDRVKIETRFATSVYRMRFEKDHMILTDPNGASLSFTKVAAATR